MMVMALDRKTGKTVWERTAREQTPHEGHHQQFGTWASSSAVTDGEVLIASFESRGFYAYDMNGTLLWEADLGDKRMRNEFGEGSTPALYKDRLVIVWDHQGESFIAALDKKTGKEIWRQKREEIDSWATPLVVENGGKPQVVTGAMNRIRSYDLATGALVWEGGGLTMNPIPSPVYEDGLVILMSGFRGNALKAVRLADARGDVTNTPAIAWSLDRDTPYVPSPLLYDGVLYFLKGNTGVLSVFDARTGKPHYQVQRIENVPNVFASPVGADGKVIVLGQDGAAAVIKHGPTYELLATNKLDDKFDGSPALVDGEMYLRGYRYLYCVSEK
jgi:outer membrane protein assembly factor BamB